VRALLLRRKSRRRKKKNAKKIEAQAEFRSAVQARVWADGDFDADQGLAFDGRVGRSAHSSRARGPRGTEAAAFRAPLLRKN
jgi:hypothetical protein